ncbi:hypothetical protein EXIGLDRAFT_724751 [Exidia glandulosa HHB12029]|uniref:Uncharacterized protein n=1 Tax=Exidia glandulosa HHB12029 TaxID=1314781 RepID=A0A165EAV8_EXIGL|nr:hypothetical protein EXIGLDRAFT_724751 [Exidia glandulosa HHB12029]
MREVGSGALHVFVYPLHQVSPAYTPCALCMGKFGELGSCRPCLPLSHGSSSIAVGS